MKPYNFPERKRQRQIGALKRLENRLTYMQAEHPGRNKAIAQAKILTLSITTGNQRSSRSKKKRN